MLNEICNDNSRLDAEESCTGHLQPLEASNGAGAAWPAPCCAPPLGGCHERVHWLAGRACEGAKAAIRCNGTGTSTRIAYRTHMPQGGGVATRVDTCTAAQHHPPAVQHAVMDEVLHEVACLRGLILVQYLCAQPGGAGNTVWVASNTCATSFGETTCGPNQLNSHQFNLPDRSRWKMAHTSKWGTNTSTLSCVAARAGLAGCWRYVHDMQGQGRGIVRALTLRRSRAG